MPLIVAIAIRYIIMAAVQLGIWSLIEKYGLPLINRGIQEIIELFGVSEEDAKDIMANEIIVALESVGIFAVTLRTKLPIKVAERLGFTSKGFALRKLSSKAAATKAKTAKIATATKVTSSAEVGEIAKVVAQSRSLNGGMVSTLLNHIWKFAGVSTGLFFTAAAYIDFANWQGPYQGTFQKLLAIFGIKADTPLPKAGVISDDMWKRIYSTVEELGPRGVSFPFSGVDKIYSRQALADLVDEIAANMIKNGESPTFKSVMAFVLPLVQLGGKKIINNSAVSPANEQPKTTAPTSTVKVFTGIVSQGVVGQGLVFTPRPDDLIESVTEMRDAAANNLAPYLATLPSKVVYEVKVVSSITTKDGFKQTGTTQQVLNGYNKNGTPKYKNVTNKFATLVLYIMTDRNTRTKLTTIVLGPVDSAKLQVQQNDLRALENQLPNLVTTQDVNEITGIETANPITVSTPPQTVTPTPKVETVDEVDTGFRFYSFTVNGEEYLDILPWLGNIPTGYTPLTQTQFLDLEFQKIRDNPTRWKAYFDDLHRRNPKALTGGKSGYYIKDGIPYQTENALVPNTVNSVTSASATGVKAGANALTLSEWYQAQGQSLPSVSVRSAEYERLGLGSKNYYTGTSEQNTKLLNALKSA